MLAPSIRSLIHVFTRVAIQQGIRTLSMIRVSPLAGRSRRDQTRSGHLAGLERSDARLTNSAPGSARRNGQSVLRGRPSRVLEAERWHAGLSSDRQRAGFPRFPQAHPISQQPCFPEPGPGTAAPAPAASATISASSAGRPGRSKLLTRAPLLVKLGSLNVGGIPRVPSLDLLRQLVNANQSVSPQGAKAGSSAPGAGLWLTGVTLQSDFNLVPL